MIKTYPYEQLGRHRIDWLDAHYHFSFGDYYNPQRVEIPWIMKGALPLLVSGRAGGCGNRDYRSRSLI